MKPNVESKKPATLLALLGVVACAICCSIPLLVGAGVGGAAITAVGVWAETAAVTFLGVGLGAAALVSWRRRQRHGAACSLDCGCRHQSS